MTDLPRNAFKAGLAAGKVQHGLWCGIADPLVAEMCAALGYDWMMFDTEHTALDLPKVLTLMQAIAPYPVAPLVRPASLDPAAIKRWLDIGAQTLLIPMINTVEEAQLAAASVAYPPHGIRGVAGSARASRFGTVADYHLKARDEICLLVQVETVEAMGRIEEIAAVPGIDGIFVGPADLAASLGHPGQPGHPEVRTAVLDSIRRIVAAGKPAGFLSTDPAYVEEVTEAGATFVSSRIDLVELRRALTR